MIMLDPNLRTLYAWMSQRAIRPLSTHLIKKNFMKSYVALFSILIVFAKISSFKNSNNYIGFYNGHLITESLRCLVV